MLADICGHFLGRFVWKCFFPFYEKIDNECRLAAELDLYTAKLYILPVCAFTPLALGSLPPRFFFR